MGRDAGRTRRISQSFTRLSAFRRQRDDATGPLGSTAGAHRADRKARGLPVELGCRTADALAYVGSRPRPCENSSEGGFTGSSDPWRGRENRSTPDLEARCSSEEMLRRVFTRPRPSADADGRQLCRRLLGFMSLFLSSFPSGLADLPEASRLSTSDCVARVHGQI